MDCAKWKAEFAKLPPPDLIVQEAKELGMSEASTWFLLVALILELPETPLPRDLFCSWPAATLHPSAEALQ